MTVPVAMPVSESDRPDQPCQAYKDMESWWEVCRDAIKDTDAFRAKSPIYAPKKPLEHDEDYYDRIQQVVVLGFMAATVESLGGQVLRVPPTPQPDVPKALVEHWEDIDGIGTHGTVFSGLVLDELLTTGSAGILVDYPVNLADGLLTLRDVRERNLRPYWVLYAAEDILSWRYTMQGAGQVLTQLVLRQKLLLPDGEFGETKVNVYRVYKRSLATNAVTVDIYRETTAQQRQQTGQAQLEKLNDQPLPIQGVTEIPFVWASALRTRSIGVVRPPLLTLARLTFHHATVRSWHLMSLRKAASPLLHITGRSKDERGKAIVVGPGRTLETDIGGTVVYVETTGAAIGQTREEQSDIIGQMAAHGLSMLSPDPRYAETAEAKRLDKSQSDSKLAKIAFALEDALERAAQFHAQYLNLGDDAGGEWKVNREFEPMPLDAAMIDVLLRMRDSGAISTKTYLTLLKRYGILTDDVDVDEEAVAAEDEATSRLETQTEITMPPAPPMAAAPKGVVA